MVWYNPAFREQILAGQDALLAAPDRLMTGIDLSVCARAHGQDLTIDENRYTAYATTSRSSKTGTLLFFGQRYVLQKHAGMNTLPAARLT